MVPNIKKQKKKQPKNVLQKATGWKEVGLGPHAAIFRSERVSYFTVMGRTKFYPRPADAKFKKKSAPPGFLTF